MNETITLLNSNQWNEKRDGLANIKLMMQSNRLFTRQELKRLCDIFSKLFSENNNKVFGTFMETLEMFIRLNKIELKDWLSVLLPKLLHRLGLETSQNLYTKLCTCLEAIRSSFDIDHQFRVLTNSLAQTSNERNPKWKVAILKYLQDIVCLMDPVDFQINEEFKTALTRVVALTSDPKSQEARRASQAVIIGLFNLNTTEFSMLMNEMPVNIQQTCTEVLKQHMKNLSIEPNRLVKKSPTTNSNMSNKMIKPASQFFAEYMNENSAQLSHVIKDIQNLNMNTNFYKPKKLDTLSKDSGVQSNVDADSDSDGATSSISSSSKLPSIAQILSVLNPSQTTTSNTNTNTTSTTSEKLKAMKDLTELIKAGNRPESNWDENFKNVLLYLFQYLEHMSSSNENTIDQSLDIQTLLCLKELLQFHYKQFKDYIELTIIKLFSNYKESPQNELYKLVEEVIYTAARCLPPESTSRVLKPIIEQAEYPRNLIAIRMLQKTVEQMNQEMGNRLLNDILPALLHAWDSPHSPVRKASVFCLVGLYMTIGESLRDHLIHLSSSKLKLLNVYINRATDSRQQALN